MGNNDNRSGLNMIATREAYGRALVDIGKQNKKLVVLDADLSSATKTSYFKKEFPDRHINCGIAEANMTGIAAGLSLAGFIPVISSFAMFATGRNFEQIRNTICYPHLNVKIAATHAGITVGEDGGTHQCNEDIALMRVIPGMTIIVPSDDFETEHAIFSAVNMKGPVYIRLGRAPVNSFNRNDNYKFIVGKGIKLTEGKDLTIIATGLGVSIALEMCDKLKFYNREAEVINIHTIKPIDKDIILESANKTKTVITIEEHSIIGGLGDAVADVLIKNNTARLLKIGVKDVFGNSGSVNDLLKEFNLTSDVTSEIIEFLTVFESDDRKTKKRSL